MDYIITSPDGRISVTVNTGPDLTFSVSHDGEIMILPSPISITLDGGTVYGMESKVVEHTIDSVDEEIQTTVYKRSTVQNRYNSLTLRFDAGFDLVFRVYDDGAAYRFVSRNRKTFRVLSENAGYNFPDGLTAYIPYANSKGPDTFEEHFFCSFEKHIPYRLCPVGNRTGWLSCTFLLILREGKSSASRNPP